MAALEEIYKTYTAEDYAADNLQDLYTLLYGVLGRRLIAECGIEGESALREATRRYGRDRGIRAREEHEDAGCYVNVYSAFNCSAGLPGNKRTKSVRFRSEPEQHQSQVLTCPMADIWDLYDCFDIGRIYCEEFHYAYYNSYGFGKTKVNLATTLTERGTDYCSFNVILRPSDLTDEERVRCFEEYSDEPRQEKAGYFKKKTAQEGYRFLTLREYYYINQVAQERLGDAGKQAVIHGLEEFAKLTAYFFGQRTRVITKFFLEQNFPAELQTEKEPKWSEYSDYEARELFQTYLCDYLESLIAH